VTAAADHALMAMILRRCGLGEPAVPLLAAIEAAAWHLIAEATEVDTIRRTLALLDQGDEAWIAARTGASPALRELLRAMIRARADQVPPDVVVGFAADALRTAILIEDAFRRGHQLALDHRPPPAPPRPRERRPARRLAH
jgi:hypothetical protein